MLPLKLAVALQNVELQCAALLCVLVQLFSVSLKLLAVTLQIEGMVFMLQGPAPHSRGHSPCSVVQAQHVRVFLGLQEKSTHTFEPLPRTCALHPPAAVC